MLSDPYIFCVLYIHKPDFSAVLQDIGNILIKCNISVFTLQYRMWVIPWFSWSVVRFTVSYALWQKEQLEHEACNIAETVAL